MDLGYFLSCEEYGPSDLLDQARRAQDAGFTSLWISDHFHPWNDAQGQSPFVWSMIGALSQVCDLPIMTAVTCPTVRIHPVLVDDRLLVRNGTEMVAFRLPLAGG